MLILIHGDDVIASKEKLRRELEDYANEEKIYLNGSKISTTEIILSCESQSIISTERAVIIENIFSKQMTTEKEKILKYLNSLKTSYKIILYEVNELDKKNISKYLPSAKTIRAQLPAFLFRFLETIGLEQAKASLEMMHKLKLQKSIEFILTMLIRQWHLLIIVKDPKSRQSSGLASWQIAKLLNQARLFDMDKLIASYRQLLQAEYQLKTGKTPYNLSQLLDLFIVNL